MKHGAVGLVGLLFGIMLALSSAAASAEEEGQRVIALSHDLKEAIKGQTNWRSCGNYFAEAESTEDKIVYFVYENGFDILSPTPAFVAINRLTISINKGLTSPRVTGRSSGQRLRLSLSMSAEDFLAGLPCLGSGTGV